jgi:hypothetical protein
MTRRICALVALAAVAAAVLADAAAAKHTLAHRVRALEAKLDCLRKYPVRAFEDYAFYELGHASVPVLTAGDDPEEVSVLLDNDSITALDFNYATGGPPTDAWLLGVNRTRSCQARFRTAGNPVSAPRLALAGARLARLE